MRDRDIAASLAAGDPEGSAAAYDRHATGLYGYCRSLLEDPSDAADAVQDAYIIAAAKLGGLRSQGRLRAWLYAVARNESQARLRAGARPARPGDPGELAAAPVLADGVADQGQDELRYLVLDAMSRLSPGEREVAELTRRHGLDNVDLASVLGVPVGQATALAGKAGEQLDRALGTLLVAGTGAGTCPGLDALLDGWDGRPTVVWRTRAGRHIDGCEACTRRRRQVLSPAMLLRLLPLPVLPDSLREHVLWLIPDDSPEAVSYRDEVIGRAGPFDPAGFPVQIAPAGWAGRSGRSGRGDPAADPGPGRRLARERPGRRWLAMAAVLLVLVGGGITALVLHGSGGRSRTTAGPAGRRASFSVPGAPGGQPGEPTPDPARLISSPPGSSGSSPAAKSSPPARTSPTPQPSPSQPAPPPAQPSKPAPPPPAPVLSESPGNVSMAERGTNEWSGSFTISAANGPISFNVSAPAGVGVSESSGTVRPGAPVTISLSYGLALLGSFPSSVSVNGITVSLSFQR
jgi:RNA polymerase sigma factor (sigma-70 family)